MKSGKVLITGSTGLLGSHLAPYLRESGHDVITHAQYREADVKFNLSDREIACECLSQMQPSTIINLVSLTSVELCEEKVNLAYLSNTRSVENIAYWIEHSEIPCHLIHISTDHVYDGNGPHLEDDLTLTNVYALSKYAGELAAIKVPSTILRTNFAGRSKVGYRESLTDWVFRLLITSEPAEVLDGVYFSPLSISVLVEMIELVIRLKPIGIYNLGSHNGMSKADFDFAFAECLNLPTNNMTRIVTNQAKFLKAYRPKDMRMNSSKFEKTLGVQLPCLRDLIQEIASEYHEKT